LQSVSYSPVEEYSRSCRFLIYNYEDYASEIQKAYSSGTGSWFTKLNDSLSEGLANATSYKVLGNAEDVDFYDGAVGEGLIEYDSNRKNREPLRKQTTVYQ
jgi:hypothetical protein